MSDVRSGDTWNAWQRCYTSSSPLLPYILILNTQYNGRLHSHNYTAHQRKYRVQKWRRPSRLFARCHRNPSPLLLSLSSNSPLHARLNSTPPLSALATTPRTVKGYSCGGRLCIVDSDADFSAGRPHISCHGTQCSFQLARPPRSCCATGRS